MATHELRSRNWFGPRTLDAFMNRAYLRAEGFSDLVFDGRPVIGISTTATRTSGRSPRPSSAACGRPGASRSSSP